MAKKPYPLARNIPIAHIREYRPPHAKNVLQISSFTSYASETNKGKNGENYKNKGQENYFFIFTIIV